MPTNNRSTKEEGHNGANRVALKTNNETNNTTPNSDRLQEIAPVIGWFSLGAKAKPSRERSLKKSWVRKGGR